VSIQVVGHAGPAGASDRTCVPDELILLEYEFISSGQSATGLLPMPTDRGESPTNWWFWL